MVAAGMLLRFMRGHVGRGPCVLYGAILGAGYLAKAVMLPLSLVFFGLQAIVMVPKHVARRTAWSVLVWVLVTAPLIVALSLSAGHLTAGSAGRLNYARVVQGVVPYRGEAGPRVSLGPPLMYEFASPVPGTFPLWYDPAYWHTGLQVPTRMGPQLIAIYRNGLAFVETTSRHSGRSSPWLPPPWRSTDSS